MIVLDTSVAVPAALPEHVAHDEALAALPRQKTRVIAQVAVETYSVLTRLPRSQRIPPDMTLAYLEKTFEFPPLVLPPADYLDVLGVAATEGLTGGGIYDVIVAATASRAGATLLTRDSRAIAAYRLVGADYRLID